MCYLALGISNSYKIAFEEVADIVRRGIVLSVERNDV
jgi:uncharacterized pyridoxal phosphate-containing UPF0001 family protein